MVENSNIKIAVIVEDPVIQNYIVLLLAGEDYSVTAFSNQNEALVYLNKEVVNLIISEFNSSNINGLEICKVLRKNFAYNFIPAIFLIPDTEPLTAAKLTFLGADDYIKKSAIKNELFLKVKLNLSRISRHQDINNITGLPGQSYLLKDIEKRLEIKEQFVLSYLTLSNFDEFNYCYGFQKGNEVLKFSGSLILNSLRRLGNSTDFLAHLYSSHFVFTTYPGSINAIANQIIEEFDKTILSFYNKEDRENGYILMKDRKLVIQKKPLMSIYIGALINDYLPVFNYSRLIQITREINKTAENNSTKSTYIKEDKKEYPTINF